MKLLFILLLFPLFVSAQTDSTLTIPLWMGRKVEADLRRKDAIDTLTKVQDTLIQIQVRQIQAKDSVIKLQQTECRARVFLCETKTNDLKVALGDEKKRRRSNGLERDIAIVGIGILLYLIAKP